MYINPKLNFKLNKPSSFYIMSMTECKIIVSPIPGNGDTTVLH